MIRTAGVPPAHEHERAGRPRSAYDYRFFTGFVSAPMG
jgi:hypothetical protein